MTIYQPYNVFEAALDRIRYLFSEFDNVLVSFSGGKDSTVILNLALMVAEEMDRLPLRVMFFDQEAEWRNNIEYIRETFQDPRIDPMWLQIPFRIFNATSAENDWLYAWEPGAEWMRPKESGSIHENNYGTDRFVDLFGKFLSYHYPDSPACFLTGVRGEESSSRKLGLTSQSTYKHITYGKRWNDKLGHYNFHPIYDWEYRDVWKAIHAHGWSYCKIYDYMFQYGVNIQKMRISNLNHETALQSLFLIQEIEPDTWVALTKRLQGINTFSQLNRKSMTCPKELPFMFSGWQEYRDYLLENLIPAEKQVTFRGIFDRMDETYAGMHHLAEMYRAQITAILVNDYHGTKLNNWERKHGVAVWRRWKHKGIQPVTSNKYING